MSTTIDEKVVEMRFDNKQFESNVATSMSTLDKLKKSLKFDGASKGLENINAASKQTNIPILGNAVEAVSAKFSALQVMGVTALANITNSAVNAGKRIASALTIDPIKTGFQEYETQINAVQTILANTSSKGTTLQQVNSALDTLNKYADKTIYNFTEMTRNIGTFTAAGVDLETSVSAIQGIANLAAVSGSTSQQASTAMYQLSQALSSGTVKLMDWNSVVNAGMGGQVFQDALKQTARVHGIAIDKMIEDEGSFRETLSKGWLTADILTETLNQFTMAAEEGTDEWEAYKKSLMDTGYTEEQAIAILKMANTATDAATKVKTFTQLWDTLKESAQSGWTESWEIIVGDFEEAKGFLTEVSDRLGSMIGESAEARNAMLSGGLSSGWKQLLNAGIADEAGYKDTFKSVAKAHGTSIDDMIAAEKKLDDSLTDTEAFQKALKTGFKDGSITADMLTESVHKMTDKMSNMSAEELKAAGYTQDHVKQIKELSTGLKDGSISMDDFVNKMTRPSGRENIIQALWNSFDGLISVIEPIKEAFREIFPPMTGEQLYKLTEQIRDLTAKFKLSEEQADKLKSVFKGVFSVFDIGLSVVKSLTKGIVEALRKINGFSGGLLDGAASFGDFLTNLRDSVKETDFFGNVINKVVSFLSNAIDKIKEFGQSLKNGFENSNSNSIFGFFKGLWDIITKISAGIAKVFSKIASTISETFGKGDILEVLNSGVLISILVGVKKMTSSLSDTFKNVGGFVENVKGILDDVRGCLQAYQEQLKAGTLLKIASAIAILAGSLFLLSTIDPNLLGGAITAITVLFVELVGAMTVFNKIGGSSKMFDSSAKKMIAMSLSILILVSALKTLSGLNWEQMAIGLTAISVLLWELVAASVVMSKTGSKMIKGSLGLIALAAAMKILASVCKDFSMMSWEEMFKGVAAIGLLLLELSIFSNIAGKAKHVVRTGLSLILIATSMKMFASALSELGKMEWISIKKGLAAMGGALVEMAAAMKLMPKGSVLKATELLIAVASLKLLAKALSDFGGMEWINIGKGLAAIGGALAELAIGLNLMKGTLGGAAALLVAALALAVVVPIMKTLGNMSWEQIAKGLITLAGAFVIIGVAGLLLKPLIVPILGLAGAFVLLGVGMLGIGAGLVLISAGITALSVALSAGATAIVASLTVIVTGVLELIPTIARIIGEGIVELAKVIGEYTPQLADSLLKLLLGVIQSLAENAPQITDALLDLLIGIINSLSAHMPALIEAFVNLLVSVFDGLGKALKTLDIGSLRDGIDAALGLSALMLAMSVALKIAGSIKPSNALKGVFALTAMVAPLMGLVGVLALASNVEVATRTVMALITLATACTLLLIPLTLVGNIGLKSALEGVISLTLMAVPMLAFVGVLALMSGIEVATRTVMALITLATACSLLLIPLTIIGVIATSGIGAAAIGLGILALTATAVPLLAFIGVLKLMSGVENATTNTMLLIALMTIMTDLLVKISLVAPLAVIGVAAIDGLVLLMGAIGVMAVAIGALMDKFPNIQKFLDTGLPILEQLAGSIGTMVGNFIGGIGEGLSDSLVKIGDNISEFMGKLADASGKASGIKGESFDGVKELMKVMLEIGGTTVGTSITDWATRLFNFGDDSMDKFEKDGVAFFNAMKAIGEAASNVNINEENMDAVIGVAQKLAELQSSLQPIGGVITWFTGRDDLGTFGVNAAAFVLSMKLAFMSLGDSELNTEAMNSIITAATSLAELQSHLEPIGGVITWFAGRDDLGTFGLNAAAFIYSMKLAFNSLDGVTFNVTAINIIIATAVALSTLQSHLEPIGGVITWFAGRDDLGTFGLNIAEFIDSMKLAFGTLDDVTFNVTAINVIVATAAALATLQSHLEPIGGVITWFNGRDDLGTFGINVAAFIKSMKLAMEALGYTTFNAAALESVITTATKLAELQSSIEPMGGVVKWFTGRNDLGKFGENIGLFADAMGKLKTGMGKDGITEATIASITNTGTALIELQKALPEEHWFDGKMNLSDFSKRIDDFATAMSTFGSKASEIDPSAVSTVINTAYRIKYLIESLADLDTSGLQTFTGIGTGGFGADGAAYEIAQTIAEFSNKVAGINTEAVSVSVWAAQRLKTLINSLTSLDTSGIENFKPQTIGSVMKGYADKVEDIDTGVVSSSITSANRLKNFIASLSDLDTRGVSSFKSAINDLSGANISAFVKAFSGASSKLASVGADMITSLIKGMQLKLPAVKSSIISVLSTAIDVVKTTVSKFESAGGAMMTRMAGGMISKKESVSSTITSCLSGEVTKIRAYYASFYSAGSYLADGLANGISANAYKAEEKAKAMAEAAEKAAREALKINSPSKVFKKIGSGIPEGFAMGIRMLGGDVKQSVTEMASTAIKSTRSTMGTILDALSADMDAQPTIRPVIDLTDVQTGANALNGMFNGVQTIGVRSNLNAINSAINAKLQNGSNDDVISAIDKLRGSFETNRGDVYNFGDFTYDDGDNISDAVRTLVRAAKMGRRV